MEPLAPGRFIRPPKQAGSRRELGPTGAALLLVVSLLAAALFLAPPAFAVTVGPGVTFQPSRSWSNISFASTQTFTTIHVDPTGVSFDSVRFGAVKSPASLPRSGIVINTWTPLQTSANATVVDFTGDAPSGSGLVFSLSNVIPAHEYVLQVDGIEVSRPLSNQTGFVSFSWSSFSKHDFQILLGWRTGLPPPPTPLSADFTFAPSNPGAGQSVAFTAAAAGGYPPYSYGWLFGDGGAADGASASHAYSSGGNYTVTLTVIDLSGDAASASRLVPVQQVAPPPALAAALAFTPARPHVADPVTFSSAVAGGTPPYAYAWTFGDGASATTASAVHAYASMGSYIVNLTVEDTALATTSATAVVNVTAAPPPIRGNVTAAFDFTVDGSTVTFVDRSTSDAGLQVVSRFWAFGDGSSSTEVNPVHSYALPGLFASYTVVLAVCNSGGHCSSVSRVVSLINWPLILLLLAIVAVAVIVVVVVVVRRRRKRRQRAERFSAARTRRPPTE